MNLTQAQSAYDNSFDAEAERNARSEAREVAIDNALDEMVGEPDCFDQWLSDRPCPSSVAGLLSLLLHRGLPIHWGMERDDELIELLDQGINSVREDFDAWAKRPADFNIAPVERWIS